MRTLKGVVGPGFNLTRFYIKIVIRIIGYKKTAGFRFDEICARYT